MVSSKECLLKYGNPYAEKAMVLWDVPVHLEIGTIPKRVYCNRDMVGPLALAFNNLIVSGCVKELRTWDGCFNIRKKRGLSSQSLHSWGIAIDVNAAWNSYGRVPTLSPKFIKCFTDAGFDWGGTWAKPDGMHFQLASIAG